jgi:hypothetical protein
MIDQGIIGPKVVVYGVSDRARNHNSTPHDDAQAIIERYQGPLI